MPSDAVGPLTIIAVLGFNSLFEMQHGRLRAVLNRHGFVSILCLRCDLDAVKEALRRGDGFNSLFEMPVAEQHIPLSRDREFQFSV